MRLFFGVVFGIVAFFFLITLIAYSLEEDGELVVASIFAILVFIPAYISYKILKKRRMLLAAEVIEKEEEAYWNSPEGKKELEEIEKLEQKESLLRELKDISGVSDKIARTLTDQFPTTKSIKEASVEGLSDIPGVGNSIAKAIKARIG